jgi:hypothetical protein
MVTQATTADDLRDALSEISACIGFEYFALTHHVEYPARAPASDPDTRDACRSGNGTSLVQSQSLVSTFGRIEPDPAPPLCRSS